MVDSLKAYEILKTAALPEPQARAILNAIGSVLEDNNLRRAKALAAKEDLAKFEVKSAAMETSLKQEMIRIEAALRVDMARLESRLETKISDVKTELLRWMFVFWIGQVATTVAIVFSAIKLVK